MKKRFYLVEDFDPSLSYEGGEILSLTPRTSFLLGRKGIPYSILENYYKEADLRRDEERYFSEQLEWFRAFDEFFKEQIRECHEWNIDLASIHYNRLKYLVDNLIIKACILNAFLEKEKPEEVIYVHQEFPEEGTPSIYDFARKDRRSYAGFVSLLARQGMIPSVSFREAFSGKKRPAANGRFWKDYFRKITAKTSRLWEFKTASEKDCSDLTVLSLDAGVYAIDAILWELVRRGAVVYVKNEKGVCRLDDFMQKPVLSPEKKVGSLLSSACLKAFEKFKTSELLNWIDGQSPFPIREMVLPYFRNFFESICPKVLSEIPRLTAFYTENHVDFVIGRSSAGVNYPAALLAAQKLGIKRVCFQHSVGPLDMKNWINDELACFDINFPMSTPSKEHFNAQVMGEPYRHCEVFESSHYLKSVRQSVSPGKPSSRPRIFYVPAKTLDGIACFNSMVYPFTWYFEYQKKILEFFGKKMEFNFFYKNLETQRWAQESIVQWLNQKPSPNISVKTGPLTRFLNEADRVIFDFPSTGLFEAAAAGIPVLALHHEAMKVWPPMLEVFGKSLQRFSSAEKAIQKIDEFLKGNPKDYLVELPLSDDNGVDILKRIQCPSAKLS